MSDSDRLYVWIYPRDEQNPVLCGALELLQGRRCLFSYDASWLGHRKAFPVSPDLPLRAGIFEPPRGCDIHPIFEDAGPDRWGKNVINKVFNPVRRSPIDYLELAGEDRIGALGFSQSAALYKVATEQAFHVADLPDLVRAADALAAQMPIDKDLRRLLRPGSSAGGARPKAIIKENGIDWIAKFPSEGDECDVCAVEQASLRLAHLSGIEVPETRVENIGGRNVLLVRRFDRAEGRRIHVASARCMLIAEGLREGEAGYADMAEVARRWSAAPKADCQQLFRRMVLNVLIENTDDHERNHSFLYRDDQWRLSPAYDIQPQIQGIGYHQMRLGKEGYAPSVSNLLSESNRFMLKRKEAEQIMEDVVGQVRDWRAVFAREGVAPRDIELCGRYIMRPGTF